MKQTELVQLAIMGAVAWFLWRLFGKTVATVEAGYNVARTGTTNIIETLFPLVNPGSMITHAVTFPDGARHAVPGESVSSNGIFLYNGIRYRIMVKADGFKVAIRV